MNVEVFLQIMVNVFTREWKNIRGKRACFRQEFAMPFGAPHWLTAVLLLVCCFAFEVQALPITPLPEMNIEYLPAADEELGDSASPTPQFKSINSSVFSFLHSPTLTSIHDYWKNHNLE